VRAIDARPELAQRLYRLLASEAPGADVRRVAEFLNAKERPTAVDAIAQEFLLSMGPEAVPVAQGTCLQLISDLERKLQRRVVVVGSQLLSVLQHSSRVASLEDLQAQEAAAAQAAAVARESTPMAWAALSEEARRIARTVASLVQQAGDDTFEVSCIDVIDGEVDADVERATTIQKQEHMGSTLTRTLEAAAVQRRPARLRVPLSSFDLQTAHKVTGGCLTATPSGRPNGEGCACREVVLLKRICHSRVRPVRSALVHTASAAGPAAGTMPTASAAAALSASSEPFGEWVSVIGGDSGVGAAKEALLDGALAVLLLSRSDAKAEAETDGKAEAEGGAKAELARRELLLRAELEVTERAAHVARGEHAQAISAISAELDGLKKAMMKMEVEQCNELERQRLRAQADAETRAARRELESQLSSLRAQAASARSELQSAQQELSRSREARGLLEEKLSKERDANATWQAHRDEQLAALRGRLITRTEQMLQIGQQLDSATSANATGAGRCTPPAPVGSSATSPVPRLRPRGPRRLWPRWQPSS